MSGRTAVPGGYDSTNMRDFEDELDKDLNKFSFTHHNQVFDDSPGKSELNQFGDFSGSHSQFDPMHSIERGMGNPDKDTDFSFRSKSAMPPMSTLSSMSSHSDAPRKAHSEGGHRSGSLTRWSPASTKKVTALGRHESESVYSPSKYYQPERTPRGASRMQPQSMRKVSPKSFKDTATLFKDLGIDDSVQVNATTMQPGQSFRLPHNIPDMSTLLSSARKASHRAIESVPVSEDNQKLFSALQELQNTVDALEQQNQEAQIQLRKVRAEHKVAEEKCQKEQSRATFAENELKQYLATTPKASQNETQIKALESRNATLLNAYNNAKKELENRILELDLAREETASVDEERNGAIARLANAHEKIDALTKEIDTLKKHISTLTSQQTRLHNEKSKTTDSRTVDERISDKVRAKRAATPPVIDASQKARSVVDDLDYSDEGIEVSKSILNESEIDELTAEIEETRRRNAKKSAAKSGSKNQDRTYKENVQTKPRTRSAAASPPRKRAASRSDLKSARTSSKIPTGKVRRPSPVLELSEDDTFASGEDDTETYQDSDDLLSSDEEEINVSYLTEDEPTQILQRRKPSQQNRNKTNNSTKVNVEKVINELSRHDSAKCTICSRKTAKLAKNSQAQRSTSAGKSSSDDANATIRPSQPPVPALHSVLAALEDEFRHLKLKYHGLTDTYNQLDPSLGKKKRKALASDLRTTIEALEGKADQIYAIFDVLEAAATGMSWEEDVSAKAAKPQQSTAAPRREWINT